MRRRIGVRLFSELEGDTVRRVFYEPVGDLNEFIKRKAEGKEKTSLALVRDAGHTVLRNNY